MKLVCSIILQLRFLMSIVVAVSFFVGCQHCGIDVSNVVPRDTTNECSLRNVGELNLNLDSVTLNFVQCVQYAEIDKKEVLFVLNEFNNSIYSYDIENHTVDEINSFAVSEYGVISGFRYESKDSLWLFSYHLGKLSLCATSQSTELKRFNVKMNSAPSKELMRPYPYVTTMSPIKVKSGKVFMSGLISGETSLETCSNRPVMIAIDVKGGKKTYLVNYPDMYQKGNWGGSLTYRLPYYDIVGDNIIVSFPASHNLVVHNVADNEERVVFAGSRFVEKIRSYPKRKTRVSRINESAVWRWYLKTPSYEGVLYDKYRDVYYRFVRIPIEGKIDENDINKKPVSVIILDSNMKYIGESLLDESKIYLPGNSFVSKAGLNIQVLTKNENEIRYERYLPV